MTSRIAAFRALMVVVGLSMALVGCDLVPRAGTKGTMPPPGPGGQVDPSAMPDFIAVAGDVGRVGWVEKAAVTEPSDRSWPVYADDLRTVVGQLVPGRGFVPAGVDPNAVPTIEVQVGAASPGAAAGGPWNVVVYVRNCSVEMVWIAVVSGGQVQGIGAAGFWPDGYIGSGDFSIGAGDRVVVLDRSPTEGGAVPRQLVYAGGSADEPVVRSVNIDKAGTAVVGNGELAWWQGVKPPC
jgi:hypothetical protein